MATTVITAPLGTITTPKFTLSLPKGMTWDPLFAKNVDLLPDRLTAISGSGAGQGACAYPEFAQHTGLFYWEYTWTGLTNPALAGGAGICTIPTIGDYASLAANGTGGLVYYPNGTVVYVAPPFAIQGPFHWVTVGPNPQPVTISEGDTIGMFVDFDADAPDRLYMGVRLLRVGGTFLGEGAGTIVIPIDAYIPCVVFDNDGAFNADAVTANFSLDRDAYLGPKLLPDAFNGVTFGWPNTA